MNQRPDKPAYAVKSARFVTSAVKPGQYPDADRPEIAFAGRSNVGKSTLLNHLLQRKKLARTSNTPGRTQLINFFDVNDELYFVDLPGYGYAKVPVSVRAAWRPMVESYLTAGRDLRLVVVLIDIRREPREEELGLLEWLELNGRTPLVVATKADKVSRGQRAARAAVIRRALDLAEPPVLFSSMTGEGREEVWARLAEAIRPPGEAEGSSGPDTPEG